MAFLYIAEFEKLLTDSQGRSVMAPHYPPVEVEQKIAIGGSSAPSAPFGGRTRFIQVHVDAICSIAIGPPNPTADNTMSRLAANETRFIGVERGQVLAVITNS